MLEKPDDIVDLKVYVICPICFFAVMVTNKDEYNEAWKECPNCHARTNKNGFRFEKV